MFTNININLLLIPLLIGSLIVGNVYYKKIKKINSFINYKQEKEIKPNKRGAYFTKALKEKLSMVLLVRKKEHLTNKIFNAFLISLFAVFLLALLSRSLFLAIAAPALMYFFTIKILDELIVGFDSVVKENFSKLVNHIIKVFSTTNDLSIVLYESSKQVDDPLRSLIMALAREIMADNSEQKLVNFIEKTENLWLHSFVLILLNYKESSSKEDVINNLTSLSDMIEKRNQHTKKMINDRKPLVIMNYMIMTIGLLVFAISSLVNPMMTEFLKTPLGNVCLLAGLSASLGTVLVNLKLTRQ